MIKLADVKHIQFELTTRCNARCPMCPRNYRGFPYNSGYPITELKLVDIQKILTPNIIAQLDEVNFNGNLGDFGLASEALEIVKYLVEHQAKKISINTNGSMRNANWWKQLALPNVSIGFALDGLEDTHHLYRQDTNWNTVIEHAGAFIAAGGNAVWRFIPFDHNQHQIIQCRQLSKRLGFSRFEIIDDGRNRGPVFDRNGKFSHRLGQPYPNEIGIPNIQPMLESHVTWFNEHTVQEPRDTADCQINCYSNRTQSIYIGADGSVYPCCWLGFYPNKMLHPGNSQIQVIAKKNNAIEYGLEAAMEWFNSVEASWHKESISQGRLYTCVSTCGKL